MNAIEITEIEITEACNDYADRHDVSLEAVDVTRNYEGGGDKVIGFRLSLDGNGFRQSGKDERFGVWQ